MEYQENTRRRVRALDGTSFRFERKGEDLYVNGMPVQIQALQGGIVALVAEHKIIQVSGADYWEIVYDEVLPTKLLAGMLLAQVHEIRGRLKHIATQKTQEEGSRRDERLSWMTHKGMV